jgi:hypothetical protein
MRRLTMRLSSGELGQGEPRKDDRNSLHIGEKRDNGRL